MDQINVVGSIRQMPDKRMLRQCGDAVRDFFRVREGAEDRCGAVENVEVVRPCRIVYAVADDPVR